MSNLFLKQEEFEKIFKSYIKVESYPKSIASLFNPRFLKKIDYKPYYQRNYVWDNDKATYFIESILLGTEVPPLIFFNNGEKIEVIDGRQRFETILRFREDKFQLTNKGLLALKRLSKKRFSELASEELQIKQIFDDAKIRIIEFNIANDSKLDSKQEDKIKKEIFSRYNSGITPLKKAEIDNARYDEDSVSKYFKEKLMSDKKTYNIIKEIFFERKDVDKEKELSIETIMTFFRKTLGLTLYPIKFYARGTGRTELMEKAYEYYINDITDKAKLYKDFIEKIYLIKSIREKFIRNDLKSNWLVFECFLWILYIIEKEEFDIKLLKEDELQNKFAKYISSNISNFNDRDYHYYNETIERYMAIADFFEKEYNLNLYVYVQGGDDSKKQVKEIKKEKNTETTLSELEDLRVTKPEPSRTSIDDILREMGKSRFMIRPSYQRSEVINYPKASAIIESIILGIPLPAIFIYKRNNKILEVIDGQQRLLTIIGFIGQTYINEQSKEVITKKHKFALKDLRILKNLKKATFATLDEKIQDKILDFQLFVVEIQENLNPKFDPIDLFIRLNDKPYPILLNSFEMWNSWLDVNIIQQIKDRVKKYRSWFYLRAIDNEDSRDRMENEELFTCLTYLDYIQNKNNNLKGIFDVYAKGTRINARIIQKDAISNFLMDASENEQLSIQFIKSIENIEAFILKLELLFNNHNLKAELDNIFITKETKYFRRTLQDFYILWFVINKIPPEFINLYRIEIIAAIRDLFRYMKDVPKNFIDNNIAAAEFNDRIASLVKQYSSPVGTSSS